MATRVALPENFGTGRQPNKAHPARTGSKLPQWLVLYVLLPKEGSGQQHPAEIRMACRATEVYESCWDRASEAEPMNFRSGSHRGADGVARHFGARARWFVWNWIGCDRSWRNTVLGRVELRLLQEPGPSGVGERVFARRRCGETAGWSLSSGTMLNTSPRHASGAHVRSPKRWTRAWKLCAHHGC